MHAEREASLAYDTGIFSSPTSYHGSTIYKVKDQGTLPAVHTQNDISELIALSKLK